MEDINNQSMAGIEDYKRQLLENFNKSVGISEAPVPDLHNYNPKPEAADIAKYITGNPVKGSNPGAYTNNIQAHNDYLDNLSNKLDRSLQTNYHSDYVTMRPYTYNGDYDGAQFERYYNSKYFKKLGFSPHQDNERLYNNRMTLGDEFVRAASFWPELFKTGFKSTMSSFTKMFTDPLSPDLQGSEEMQRAMTNGSSTKDGVGSFFVNQFLNSAYTVGVGAAITAQMLALKGLSKGAMALGEAGGLTAATKIADETVGNAEKITGNMESLRAFFNENKVGKAMAAAGRIINPLEGTWQVGKQLIRGENAIGHLSNYARWVDNFSLFAKDAIMINAAVSEARLEGGMNQMETTKALVNEYRAREGKDPDADAMASIEAQASEEARRVAFWNLPAIMWSNKFMYETIFRPFEKGGAKLIDDVVFNPKTQAFEMVGSTLKERAEQTGKSLLSPKAYLEFGRDYLKTNVAEGLQENIQEAISIGATEHAKAVFRNPERAAYENYMGHFMKGMKQQLSAQGVETFAGGFLMGSMATPVMAAPMKIMETVANKTWNREEYTNRQAEKDKNTQEVVNTLNELYKNPKLYFAPELTNVVNQTKLNQDLFSAQEEYNKKRHKDVKDLSVFEHIFTALQSGHYDTFVNQLENYKKFTPEEAGEAFYGKRDAALGKAALSQLDNVIDRAKLIKKELSDAVGSYPNPFDPSRYKTGSVEQEAASRSYTAWNEALKNLVFAKVAFQTHSKRIKEMEEAFVGKSKPIENASAQDLMVLLDPAALLTEIDLLEKETKVLTTEDKDSKKLKERKTKKLELLQNIYENIHRKSKIKEIVDSLTEEEKRSISGLSKILKGGQARKSLINYMKFLAKDTKSFVFDDKLEAALDLIGDSLMLRDEKASLVQSINVLNNPKGFFNLQNRLAQVYRLTRDNQRKILEENIKDINEKADANAALNQFYKQYGVKLTDKFLLKFYDDIKNKRPVDLPTEFIDDSTNETITTGDKFNAALESWKRMAAEISKVAADQYFKEETSPLPSNLTKQEQEDLEYFNKQLSERVDGLVKNGMPRDAAEKQAYRELFTGPDESGNRVLNKDGKYYEKLKGKAQQKPVEEKEEVITTTKKISADSNYTDLPQKLKDLLNPLYLEWVKDNELTVEEANLLENKNKFLKDNWDNILDNNLDIRALVKQLNENVVTQTEEEPVSYEPARFDVKPNEKQQLAIDKIIDIVNKRIKLSDDEKTYIGGRRRTSDVVEDLLVNVFNKEPFYKFMERKGEPAVQIVADIYNKESKDLDKLIEELKVNSELGSILDEKQFLKIKEALQKKNTFEVFKQKVNDLSWSGGSERGNRIDAAIRTYFNGLPNAKPEGMTNLAFNALIDNLRALHNYFDKNGMIVIGAIQLGKKDSRIVTSNEKVAGEMDILTVNQNGHYEIFDIKTATDDKWLTFFDDYTESSSLLRYTLQQSIYKKLLTDETGIPVQGMEVRPDGSIKKTSGINLIPIETKSDRKSGFIDTVKRRVSGLLVYATPGANKSNFVREMNQLRSEQPDKVQDVYQEFVDADRLLIMEIKKRGKNNLLPGFDYNQSDKDETVYLKNFADWSKGQETNYRESVYKSVSEQISSLLRSGLTVMTGSIDYINRLQKADLLFVTPKNSKYSRESFDKPDPETGIIQREVHDKEIEKNTNERIDITGPINDHISMFKDWAIQLRYEPKVEEAIVTKKEEKEVIPPVPEVKPALNKKGAIDLYNTLLERLEKVDDIETLEELVDEVQAVNESKFIKPLEKLTLSQALDDAENFVYNRLSLKSLKFLQEQDQIVVYNNPKKPDISGQYLIQNVGSDYVTLTTNAVSIKVPVSEVPSSISILNEDVEQAKFTPEEIKIIKNNKDLIDNSKKDVDPNPPTEGTDPEKDFLNGICD